MGGGVAWYLNQSPKVANEQAPTSKPKPKPAVKKPEPAKDPALARFITPTTGETWLPQQKKLADQQFFKAFEGETNPASYYEVGKRANNTIILGIIGYGLGNTAVLFEKTPAGVVSAIMQPDSEATYNQDDIKSLSETIKAEITKDTTIHYDSLSLPKSIDLDKGDTLGKPTYPSLGDFITVDTAITGTTTEIRKIGQSILKKTETGYVDTKLTSISYSLTTPINTQIKLTYDPLETDLSKYQWSSGLSSQDKLRPIARGCGGLGSSITRSDSVTDADVQTIGKSPSGLVVYQLKDLNHPLIQKAYDEFKEYISYETNSQYKSITREDFVKEHAIVLYKDKFGQWLVYSREQMSPAYGCAKPVVYLYPPNRQQVTVKVGADVKLSDPLYDSRTGWKVTAYPSGQLLHDGTYYSSLFWEGPGTGEYPAVTSGIVVKTSDAIPTIKRQLKEQGLNQNEISDFVDYWQDKLPNKSYTRLTWFNTEQLNELAPLSVTPRPDTIIRVFLDFSGLDQPIKLPPQELKSIPRSGFTVVEWGGLSPKKLY